MGIVNVTPDSFSDGGRFFNPEQAIAHGMRLAEEGADIIDIGGESTRPGSVPISAAEELKRVLPVIRELSARVSIPLSIDTTKAVVAQKALEAGAELVNDVSALRFDPGMAELIAACKVPVVLMHMRGTPQTMQQNTCYAALLDDVRNFLRERIASAVNQGIAPEKIIIDPGIGFGKSVQNGNLIILKNLDSLLTLGRPILVGTSRKAFIGKLIGTDVNECEEGTAATVAIAVYNGAHFIRVHNVATMKRVAIVANAIKQAQ